MKGGFENSGLWNYRYVLKIIISSKPLESALEMQELISKHFTSVTELIEWSENTFEKVNFDNM